MSELKLEKFDQIGIVVKDIEKTKPYLGGLFKFQSKLNIVEQNSTVKYKGKEVVFKMKKMMQNFAGKQFEIVEVIESSGDHLYLDFIKEGNEGLHHLGVYTKNAEELITEFKSKYNLDVVQTGKAGKVNFFYLDTRKLIGFYLELISF
ncbi:MAG: VOC family protein [Candidatus Lokiarchaeota archaeon]|nr:VOC family protein [Candidatus Lokiarchaeota archaeon]